MSSVGRTQITCFTLCSTVGDPLVGWTGYTLSLIQNLHRLCKSVLKLIKEMGANRIKSVTCFILCISVESMGLGSWRLWGLEALIASWNRKIIRRRIIWVVDDYNGDQWLKGQWKWLWKRGRRMMWVNRKYEEELPGCCSCVPCSLQPRSSWSGRNWCEGIFIILI